MDKRNLNETEEILEIKWFPEENKFKYKVKCRGYSEIHSKWIDSDAKFCQKLIQQVEETKNKNEINKKKKIIEDDIILDNIVFGDINIDKPSKLLGLKREKSELLCLVGWENKDKHKSIVKYDIFRNRYPYLVLDFYEKRLKFIDKK